MEDLSGAVLYGLKQKGKTRAQIAAFTGLSMGAVGGRIYRYEQTLKGAPPEKPHLFNINLGAPIAIEGSAVVLSDIQAPTTDLDMARLVIPTAQRHGIRRLIMNGDSLNVDWLSGYPVIVEQPRARQEIDSTAYLIEEWLRWFDEVIFLPGNHETRFLKANAGNLEMRNLLSLLTSDNRVVTSNYDHLTLKTEQGRWMICHGTSYSVNQLVVADQMAQKYQANIVMGHQHHAAIGWDRFKRWVIVDNGGLFSQKAMSYVTMRATKMANMQTGFVVLDRGYPTLYGPAPMTDWDRILEDEVAQQPALRIADAA
jgi:predicted phosphodiesterase